MQVVPDDLTLLYNDKPGPGLNICKNGIIYVPALSGKYEQQNTSTKNMHVERVTITSYSIDSFVFYSKTVTDV